MTTTTNDVPNTVTNSTSYWVEANADYLFNFALGKLPPRVAQVFQLYAIEERPNAEVCERMNISESNLWVMLHRARKQLREHLEGWWNGDSAGSVRLSSIGL